MSGLQSLERRARVQELLGFCQEEKIIWFRLQKGKKKRKSNLFIICETVLENSTIINNGKIPKKNKCERDRAIRPMCLYTQNKKVRRNGNWI